MWSFHEYFAGGGMARAGLGPQWQCLFANDIDVKKTTAYAQNWGSDALVCGDVARLAPSDIPGRADLAWASFPCQDLSVAGAGAGLKGQRSGTFWAFWTQIQALVAQGRAPKTLVLENVCGTLTSHRGADFTAICAALAGSGYRFGAIVVDAALFLPHSRPRLFIIALSRDMAIPAGVRGEPSPLWHTGAVHAAYARLSAEMSNAWVWWHMPPPVQLRLRFADIAEKDAEACNWHSPQATKSLLAKMSVGNLAKVEMARQALARRIGTVYKRTRLDENGAKVQRAEVRFDGLAGCLRTPGGGSSLQTILVVEQGTVKSRLISARETARLMGLPETYRLPPNYNDAYHLTGDGVVVPVVRHLASHILEPILEGADQASKVAA